MYGLGSTLLETSLFIGSIGGICLDVAIGIYNRIVRVAFRIALPSLFDAIWTSWLATIAFLLLAGSLMNILGRLHLAVSTAMILFLFVASHAVAFCWQLRIRFRPALGLSLIHSTIMLSVGATTWLLLFIATTERVGL